MVQEHFLLPLILPFSACDFLHGPKLCRSCPVLPSCSVLCRKEQPQASLLTPLTMSWRNLLVEFLLITAGVIPEETKMMTTAESTPSANQTTGHAQAETTVTPKVAPANLQQTGQATIHLVVNTTTAAGRTLVASSEPRTDQTGMYMAIKTTVPAQRTISKPEPLSSQKTTTPAATWTTGTANKTAAKTTNKHTARPVTTPTTNSWAHSNRTSVPPEKKTMAPMLTAPVGPTLAPKPSPAATGAYSVSNGTAECIKARIGLTMIVKNSQTNPEYLNVDPNVTHTTGVCGNGQASITISFQGGFIRFHFTKNVEIYFVSVMEASLTVPSEGSLYSGIKAEQLFSTPVGNCFKCLSKQTVDMASNFQLWMVNSQLQAFDIVGNQFGKEKECALDRNKSVIPIAVGLSLAGLLVIVFVTRVIYRRKQSGGYDRI